MKGSASERILALVWTEASTSAMLAVWLVFVPAGAGFVLLTETLIAGRRRKAQRRSPRSVDIGERSDGGAELRNARTKPRRGHHEVRIGCRVLGKFGHDFGEDSVELGGFELVRFGQ